MNFTDLLRRILPAKYRPYQLICRWIDRVSGGRILGGPFKGMRYLQYLHISANISLVVRQREVEG
jgi:hypothetical protein